MRIAFGVKVFTRLGTDGRSALGKRLLCLVTACLLSGCYYMQAAGGQLEVLRKREPIAEVINDPETPEAIANRLRLVNEAREFSILELGLPDNKSYASYSDLERDYVIWNVIATEEFSLEPKTWCYPIVGCLAYRGYFKRPSAERLASDLRLQGYDVFMGGVAAYSTLGKFNDPVLNTMMHWDDAQLVSVLFHELAHQVLYIKGDTGFNESFATAVEEIGVERFLRDKGRGDDYEAYRSRRQLKRQLMAVIEQARGDLRQLFSRDIDNEQKRELKEARLSALKTAMQAEFVRVGRDPDAWFRTPLNNARLASLSLYEGLLPQFRQMLANCDQDLGCFYDEAKRLGAMDAEARTAALRKLGVAPTDSL